MKKIFYILASAIVALGAMACQNEVDENITPENTNEISFTVSFDESTRVDGTVEGKTASFVIEGSEILTIGDAELSYDEEKEVFVATSDEDKATLNGLIGKPVTATIKDEQNNLKFVSAEFDLAQKNEITVSLACPALYFTVPADVTVALTVNEKKIADYLEGYYFLGIEGPTAKISYSIDEVKVKETTLTGLANKVYNLGTLGTNMTIANVAALIENAEAGSITLPKNATITGSEILTINNSITINGNGATFTSKAARAINVSGEGVEATIENLTVVCSGERGVNVIQNAKSVTLNNVNITAANYAVNVASSAGAAQIAITNSTLHGLCTVNVASPGADVTLDKCIVYCDDNNTTAGESYAALSLGKESVGGSIIATNTDIYVAEGSDSFAGRNSAKNGTVTINGSEDKVCVVVAVITYDSPYYHGFANVDAAIKYIAENDIKGTITLIRDAEISTVGTHTINVNDCTLTPAEGYVATDNGDGTWTVDKTYKVYVIAQPKSSAASWKTINLYAWKDKEEINAPWPGVNITNNITDINGYTYYYYTFPASFNNTEVSVIVNNGTNQTDDIALGTLNKDYYVVYNEDRSFEVSDKAYAAGSIEEYVAPAEPLKLYLKPNSNWKVDNARFAAYFFGNGDTWVSMTDSDSDGIYEVEVPNGFTKVIFCRMSPSAEANNWGNKWNQTEDLTIPNDGKNLYTVKDGTWDNGGGTWSVK